MSAEGWGQADSSLLCLPVHNVWYNDVQLKATKLVRLIYTTLLRAISFMRQHRHAFSYDSYASTVGTCCLLRQFERHRATLEVAPSIPRATAAWTRTSSSSSSWDAASSACTVGISWATRPRSDNLKHKIRRKAWR